MTHPTGQYLGNYRLLRLLGQGGFALVYLGEHRHLGTQAAIKLLNTRLGEDQVALFQQEARMLAQLNHPHIVRVLDYDVVDRFPYLVMEYASGGTLRQRHPKGVVLPLATVIPYIEQIADALDYAHHDKLIHRDVKPENILINQKNQIVLSDFGVASIAHDTQSQTAAAIAGTVPYMAPEQLQGHPRTASDQYSLGIIIYEWLSGERPFVGSTGEIVSQHLIAPPPPLVGRIPGITPAIEEVLFTALAKDPRQRFATMHDFFTALDQVSKNSSSTSQAHMLHSTNNFSISSDATYLVPLMAAPQIDTPASADKSLTTQTAPLTQPSQVNTSASPMSQAPTPQIPTPQAPRMTTLRPIIHQYRRRKMLIAGSIIALIIVMISTGTWYTLSQSDVSRSNVGTTTNKGTHTGVALTATAVKQPQNSKTAKGSNTTTGGNSTTPTLIGTTGTNPSNPANTATTTAIPTTSTTHSNTTPTPTSALAGGSNGVTATGTVAASKTYYIKEAVTYSNTATITAMTITITVLKTTGVSYNGAYATGTSVAWTHVDTGNTIVYTYTLNSGQSVSPDTNEVGAQFNLSGTTHSTTGDQWSITTTCAGVTNTTNGQF